jgi:MFS family permease
VKPIFYGWRVVFACFVIAMFGWGLGLFGSSVYLQAVTSAHGWTIAEVSSAISVFFFVSAAIQGLVGRSISRYGPRPALLVGSLAMTLAVALIGCVGDIWQLYPCFVLLGLGWATLSTTGISATVAPWFERHQGRSMTLAIMGASFGAIFGVPLLLIAIEKMGLRNGLVAVGFGSAIVLIPIVALVLRYRGPGDIGLRRDGAEETGIDAAGEAVIHIANEFNRRRLIWSSTIAFGLVLLMQIGFITHHVALAQPFLGTAGAGVLVSATGVIALCGRLYLLKVIDQVPVRRLACQAMFAQFAALVAIGLFPNVTIIVIASLIYGFAMGNVTTLSPVVVRREFGADAFGSVYGTAATAIQFTTAFGPALIGNLRAAFGGYPNAFLVAAVATAIGCAVLHFGGERDA